MRAAQLSELAGPQALRLVDAPEPQFGGSGVLIDVKACGVTFPDVLLTRGLYQEKPELPFAPGLEVAGVVLAASPEASVSPGDRVTAFLPRAGGMAERAIAPVGMTFPLVDELDFAEGAGLTANAHTAHFALARRGGLREGELVL